MSNQRRPSPKSIEEKRKVLPIYEHYTLTPGKTKSHHPEAKCNHCQRDFICGSKQRLIRHIKKCNNVTNSDQIVADTLNALAQNSSTGHLNQSILEASDLLPSRYQRMQLYAAQRTSHNPSESSSPNTTVNTSTCNNSNNCSESNNTGTTNGVKNQAGVTGSFVTFNGSTYIAAPPGKRGGSARKGKKSNHPVTPAKGILHVTTGVDGKAHFTPASQLTNSLAGALNAPLINSLQNRQGICLPTTGRYSVGANQPPSSIKLNAEAIDKAYIKLVLTRNLHLSLCDTKEFQQWLKLFSNEYKPPSSINLISQILKQEATAAKHKISNILVKAPKKTINLELHNWSCKLRGHVWYAIIANLDQKRFLVSLQDILLKNNSQNKAVEVNINTSELVTNNNSPNTRLIELIDDCISKIGKDRINSLLFNESIEKADMFIKLAQDSLKSSHPSIISYNCWWNFTNLICADIIERNSLSKSVLNNANRLINFINKRPKLNSSLPCFSPFVVVNGQLCPRNDDKFWYCHLVCYLLDFLKYTQGNIIRAIEANSNSQVTNEIPPDNNNHMSLENNIEESKRIENIQAPTGHNQELEEMRTLVMSNDFWSNLNLCLIYLKPIQDLIALTSTKVALVLTNSNETNSQPTSPPSISLAATNNLSLSDFMYWFLGYGKTLFDDWTVNPDTYKQQLIESYLRRFQSALPHLKLLFAAYLLNPRYKCAYVTSQAKIHAIEEILNIASEFMPEESDGHTIFDQWKLYLKREEPYDMVFDETRTTPLEWWTSLPCAESIRRVALRILRLKAMSSFKPEGLFMQLNSYEDESNVTLDPSAYEDLAILRYLYAYEDKSLHCIATNGFTQIGSNIQQSLTSTKFLPGGEFDLLDLLNRRQTQSSDSSNSKFRQHVGMDISYGGDEVGMQNLANNVQPSMSAGMRPVMIEELSGYDIFKQYVDYTELGVQVIEEPAEKKRRKWTAQEILSKCQTSNDYTNNQSQHQANTE